MAACLIINCARDFNSKMEVNHQRFNFQNAVIMKKYLDKSYLINDLHLNGYHHDFILYNEGLLCIQTNDIIAQMSLRSSTPIFLKLVRPQKLNSPQTWIQLPPIMNNETVI